MKTSEAEKRIDVRLNKVFSVILSSELFGDSLGVARNISPGGMLIEMGDPLPLGAFITVHFRMPDCAGDIVAQAEVKHHYCLNYAVTGEPAATRCVGVRFVEFESEAGLSVASLPSGRVLH